MIAKEWKKSQSTMRSLNDLIHGIVVFEDFFKRGFGVPVHPFLQGLLLYYKIGICNLHPNFILLVSTFIHLCEAYVAIEPHFDVFRYLSA